MPMPRELRASTEDLLNDPLIQRTHDLGAVFVTSYDKREEAGYYLFCGWCEVCGTAGVLQLTHPRFDEGIVYGLARKHAEEIHNWTPVVKSSNKVQ